jgi:hypothetical protein
LYWSIACVFKIIDVYTAVMYLMFTDWNLWIIKILIFENINEDFYDWLIGVCLILQLDVLKWGFNRLDMCRWFWELEIYFSASVDLNDLMLNADNFIHFLSTITTGLQQTFGGTVVCVHVKKQYGFIQSIIWKVMHPLFQCIFMPFWSICWLPLRMWTHFPWYWFHNILW